MTGTITVTTLPQFPRDTLKNLRGLLKNTNVYAYMIISSIHKTEQYLPQKSAISILRYFLLKEQKMPNIKLRGLKNINVTIYALYDR